MDTAFVIHSDCGPPYGIFYYSVKAKYPVSSDVLRAKARDYLKGKIGFCNSSGYITFRFFINCKGTMSRVRVFQTDEYYKSSNFPKQYVEDLYQFVKTMDLMAARNRLSWLETSQYLAFITFKIKDGKIDNIIP